MSTLETRLPFSFSTPKVGSKVIPALAESGALAYLHADQFEGLADGTVLSSWADLIGTVPAFTPTGGTTAAIDDSHGSRMVKLTGSGSLWSGSTPLTGIPDDFTIAALLYVNENPAAVCYAISTIGAGTNGVLAAISSGVMRAYGVGLTTSVSSSSVSKPALIPVVASFNYDATSPTAKVKVGAQAIVTGAISFTSTPTSQGRTIRMTGSGLTSGLWVRKMALLDHYCTDAEVNNLVAEMAA